MRWTNMLKIATLATAVTLVSACGGGDDGGIFGTEDALSCIQTATVSDGIDVTNTCDSNVIVLTNQGERLVLGPGVTNKLINSSGLFAFGACFSPNEPVFESNTEFVCG